MYICYIMLSLSHEAAATRQTCNKLQEIQHCFENDYKDLTQNRIVQILQELQMFRTHWTRTE